MSSTQVMKKHQKKLPMSLNASLLALATSPCMFEHPLNHGKRLGIIRLAPHHLSSYNALNDIKQQLRSWQKEERVIGVWFEPLQSQFTCFDDMVSQTPGYNESFALCAVKACIKAYSKVTMFWQANEPLASIANMAQFHLQAPALSYEEVIVPVHKSRSKSVIKLRYFSVYQGTQTKASPTKYQISCQRSRILEHLSSHPWHQGSCRDAKSTFKQLLNGSTQLT